MTSQSLILITNNKRFDNIQDTFRDTQDRFGNYTAHDLSDSNLPYTRSLSRAISRHARNARRLTGSTRVEQTLRTTREREWQSSCEAPAKVVHNLLHLWASTPEGPSASKVLIVAERIRVESIWSNMTGWKDGGRI